MKKLALASFVAVLTGSLSFVTSAKDTDIYTKAKDMGRDDTPNVLIIFDTSGSMGTDAVTIREPYDATKVYATYGNIVEGRVYWSYPDPTNGTVNPPLHDTNRWFSATNNNCNASKAVLSVQGTYGGDHMAAYGKFGWGDFFAGKDYVVDCEADDGATDPNGYVNKSKTPMYTTIVANQITWGGQKTPSLYTANYMNWYYGAPKVTKTRIEVAQQTVNNIIQTNPSLRFGLMVFNSNPSGGPHGGRVVFSVDNMTATRLTAMTTTINSLQAIGMTPLAETMWEAYSYMAGKAVDFGNDAPSETPGRDLTAEDAAGNYVTPFKYDCQEGYIIYMTDGDPTNDTSADARIAALPGIAPKNSSSKPGYVDGSYLDELAEWMQNHDLVTGNLLTTNKGRRVSTYTIGFGNGISASGKQLLMDTAAKGSGKYYAADDADQLSAAFQGALTEILKVTASFVAPALSVNAFNTLFNRDEIYFSLFKAGSSVCWTGNIKKYTLCTGLTTGCTLGEVLDKNGAPAIDRLTLKIKDTATSFWSPSSDGNEVTAGGAGANIPAPASRKVYTYTGGYSGDELTPSGTKDLTTAENLVADGNTAITAAMLGVPIGTTTEATDRTAVINWMLGYDAFDADADNVFTETRSWSFSDPLHSRPVAVTYGGTNTNPVVKLFVGTNDGGLRMINEYNGQEEWIFYPKELLGIQWKLANDESGDHLWGMDGTPKFRIRDHSSDTDTTPDGIIDASIGDFVHMFITMRRGGRNVYALDVTPATTVNDPSTVGQITPRLLWVIRGGVTPGYEKLSQTWSDAKATPIRYGTGGNDSTAKTVLIFGGGYDDSRDTIKPSDPYSPDDLGNAIFMVDPATGQRIWWASNTGSGANLELPGMDFSIPSEIATMDADGDGETDRLYFGDTGGQMWRIDLSPTLNANSTGTPPSSGYRLADVGCTSGSRPTCTGTPAQDHRKFFYPPDVAQVYDSTYEDSAQQKYDIVTIATGDREDPLDFLTDPDEPVHNRIYAFRDYRTRTGPLDVAASEIYNPTIRESDLFDSTANPLQDPAADTTAIKASKGWFIDLPDASGKWVGEKSLAKTVIFAGKLMVTTFTPANIANATEKCKPNEGDATLYVLNLLSGAGMEDLDGDDTIDRKEDVGGGIPSELVTIIRPGGVSGLVGPYDPQKAMGNTKLPRTKTFWNQ